MSTHRLTKPIFRLEEVECFPAWRIGDLTSAYSRALRDQQKATAA